MLNLYAKSIEEIRQSIVQKESEVEMLNDA
jgi:hypothetical protein